MPAPSWLILAWSAFVATCAAAMTGALLGGSAPATWSLLPQARGAARALAGTAALGLVLYPVLYALVFEVAGRADATLGLLLGAVHALAALLAAGPRRRTRAAFRVAAMHFTYAVTLSFLYVTP